MAEAVTEGVVKELSYTARILMARRGNANSSLNIQLRGEHGLELPCFIPPAEVQQGSSAVMFIFSTSSCKTTFKEYAEKAL